MKSTDIKFGCFFHQLFQNFQGSEASGVGRTGFAREKSLRSTKSPMVQDQTWERMEAENHDVIITTMQSIPKKGYFGEKTL